MAVIIAADNVELTAKISENDNLSASFSPVDDLAAAMDADELVLMSASLKEETGTMAAGFGDVVIVTPQSNYEALFNKPAINSVTLVGDQTGDELKLVDTSDYLTYEELYAAISQAGYAGQ